MYILYIHNSLAAGEVENTVCKAIDKAKVKPHHATSMAASLPAGRLENCHQVDYVAIRRITDSRPHGRGPINILNIPHLWIVDDMCNYTFNLI